jgi:hypothetical protein
MARDDDVTIQPPEFPVVHLDPLAFQHEPDTAIDEAPALSCDLGHALPYLGTVGRALSTRRLRIDADQPAGAALRQTMTSHRHKRRIPTKPGRRLLFPKRSFSTALSSIASTRSQFNRAFSSISTLFSLGASDTSSPPYFAFYP